MESLILTLQTEKKIAIVNAQYILNIAALRFALSLCEAHIIVKKFFL